MCLKQVRAPFYSRGDPQTRRKQLPKRGWKLHESCNRGGQLLSPDLRAEGTDRGLQGAGSGRGVAQAAQAHPAMATPANTAVPCGAAASCRLWCWNGQ